MESQNCNHEDIDTLDYYKSNLHIADELYFKRRFSGAIDHYTRALSIDSQNINNEYIYFQRGMLRLFFEEYDNALYDFTQSFLLFYYRVKYEPLLENVEFSEGAKMEIIQQLIEGFALNNLEENKDLAPLIQTLRSIDSYYKYDYLISFCIDNRDKNK